ncbi:MAG: hypothetical protein ACTSSG_06275 [Candidatus Heimdallarchaeaceae archaeon]
MSTKVNPLTLKQLGLYLAEKQNLIQDYRGLNYGHCLSIIDNLILFQDIESLFARMRSYSHNLISSLVKNKHLVHAPIKAGKLAYVGREFLPLFKSFLLSDEFEYTKEKSKAVLEYLNEKGSSTRTKIMSDFAMNKEEVMEVLMELRSLLQIYMYYDGSHWIIYSSKVVDPPGTISKSLATTKLIFSLIRSLGPITVPQIMKILNLPGGRVSTSIIELYEKKKIVRGQFIENSSYESFLSVDELEHLEKFTVSHKTNKQEEIQILPCNDILAEYWEYADFFNMDEIKKILVLSNGQPICSFNFKIIGDNLNVVNLTRTSEYNILEEKIRRKIQEFAENKGKILVFPKLHTELLKIQSKSFARVLIDRGYSMRTQGLVYPLSKFIHPEHPTKLVSFFDLLLLLFDKQFLTPEKMFSRKGEILKGLSILGIPSPMNSLKIRTKLDKVELIDDLVVNKQVIVGKYGAFNRGIISADDFPIYSRLSPEKHLGILEEKVLNYIIKKEKIEFKQLRASMNLSDKVLLSVLQKLETSNKVIQSKSLSNKIIWYSIGSFFKGKEKKKMVSQKEAWLSLIFRILSSNLPLTITQLANITGLSNTQVESYLKELIASKGVRSGRYFKEEQFAQFTTKEMEELIAGYLYQKDTSTQEKKQVLLTYLPKDEPLLLIYRNYFLKRFKMKSIFLHPLPSDFAELILINGNPMAAIQYKKQAKVQFINNIETLSEFSDTHSLMLIFSALEEYFAKTKQRGTKQIRIKQINGVPLLSDGGKKIVSLIKDMKLDFIILPE